MLRYVIYICRLQLLVFMVTVESLMGVAAVEGLVPLLVVVSFYRTGGEGWEGQDREEVVG